MISVEEVFEENRMMKKEELRRMLIEKGVPTYYYNIDGNGRTDEHLCLEFVRADNEWSVYFLERGEKTTDVRFATEEEACCYMYQELCT